MSDRLLKVLAGALVLLLAAWGLASLISGRDEGAVSASFELAADSGLAIDSVIIVAPTGDVRLQAGDGWTVNGYEAIPETGDLLRRALAEAEVGQLVSRNPDNHERLGVTEADGRKVTVYGDGAVRFTLIVGNRGQAMQSAYARRPGDDEVYALQGNLVNLVNRAVDAWRDRKIIAADRDAIQRIECAYGDTVFTLARDSAGWRIEPSGAAVQDGAVSAMLGQLANLSAVGFAADSVADTLTWEPPSARMRVVGLGGAELGNLVFLDREAVGYYVRRAGSPVVYEISSYTGDQILKRENDLAPTAPDEDAN